MSGSSFCAGWAAFCLLVAMPAACAEPLPAPSLDHLAALSDIRGVSEFARGRVPLRERFCLEDTARALVAVLRVHAAGSEPRAAELARSYLRAIVALRAADADPAFSQIAKQLDAGARISVSSERQRSCPTCGAHLAPTTLFGVDLDYCQTHGTFFDCGEVAKLRAAGVDGKGKSLSIGATVLGVLEILSFFS